MIVYVLKLQRNKFYVGITNDLKSRLTAHTGGYGAQWTKLYPPMSIFERIDDADLFDEDKYVIKYMALHGVENVRGGSYSQLKLDPVQIKNIRIQIANVTNSCFRCGSSEHFAKNCSSGVIDAPDADDDYKKMNYAFKIISCFKCGKKGHYARECYSKYDINGQIIKNNVY
jgi:hypothetical protein